MIEIVLIRHGRRTNLADDDYEDPLRLSGRFVSARINSQKDRVQARFGIG